MNLNCGIIGLPNVGKSSFFNALTNSDIPSENYPFCTIEANSAIVEVRDKRLKEISSIVKPSRIIYSTVEFVDIAGLVAGASKGEGLGNQFLANIREVDSIMQILRCFEKNSILHVENRVDPVADKEIIETELILKDLESVENKLLKSLKISKNGNKEAKKEVDFLIFMKKKLEEGVSLRKLFKTDEYKTLCVDINMKLLTEKPMFYVANVDEDTLRGKENVHLEKIKKVAAEESIPVIEVCTIFEEELSRVDEEGKKIFLNDFNLKEPTVNRVIRQTYETLGLISFFTAGEKEVRSWTIPKNTKAPIAASVIHSDFEKLFIRAEVIKFDDFIKYKSESECKKASKLSSEGKDYIVQDGDIINYLIGAQSSKKVGKS